MKCAIYCRLSKEDGLTLSGPEKSGESESIQNQKALLSQYAAEMGWDIFRIYVDDDYSGADRDRPAFSQLISDAEIGCFQIILCKTQSRFTRDMELVERYLHGLFPQWGIRFIALVDHADTEIKGNKKARQINGLINEWYLEDLSENIKAVLDNKRKMGKFIGSFPVYGYRKDPEDHNRLLIDPDAAEVVRMIYSLAESGHGRQKIADFLNERRIPNPTKYKELNGETYVNRMAKRASGAWNRTTIGRILNNETYIGTMVQGKRKKLSYKHQKVMEVPREAWIRVGGTHDAIIDPEQFQAVQKILQARRKTCADGEVHLLAGKVRCGICGRTMRKTTTSYQGVRHSYLRCSECTRLSIRLSPLETLVTSKMEEHITTYFGSLHDIEQTMFDIEQMSIHKRQVAVIESQIGQYQVALEQLYLDRAAERIDLDTFSELSHTFQAKKKSLSDQLIDLNDRIARQNKPKRNRGLADDRSMAQAVLALLVGSIEIFPKDPHTRTQSIGISWLF